MDLSKEELIKEAFNRIKQEISSIRNDSFQLKEEINTLKTEMLSLCEVLKNLNQKTSSLEFKEFYNFKHQEETKKTLAKLEEIASNLLLQLEKFVERDNLLLTSFKETQSTTEKLNTTIQQIISTSPTQNPAYILPLNLQKPQNPLFSTGNEGVPTDRQTNQQTDTSTQKTPIFPVIFPQNPSSKQDFGAEHSKIPSIENASEILASLDNLKKEIRIKFKRLTEQEMTVFSTIYLIEEEQGHADYRSISERLKLTESSIRDYVGRIIAKGIPLDKTKLNNKTITLSISPSLKKIASLSTILHLREI